MSNSSFIPYGRQSISEADVQAVVEVLQSDWLTQGPTVELFEAAVADYCGAAYATAVNSATSALHIACLAAGLGADDVLWTSPNTFIASANCALYCGAKVDFVDIDPATYNLSVSELEKKLKAAAVTGTLPKVVIPVHFAGQSCEMARIAELSREYGFTVIEDASHAIGGRYRDKPVGSCDYSSMTVFSFHPVKIITTGEGGMVVTNDRLLSERLKRLRSHGITRDPALMTGACDAPWYYEQIELGFNYRITDIQAALGLSQLQRLDEFVTRRHYLADRYHLAFRDLPLSTPWCHQDTYSAFHLYVVRLHLDACGRSQREIFERLRLSGILVNLHYIPVHTQPYYLNAGFAPGMFPEAERHYAEAISLPMFFGMSFEQQDKVVAAVKDCF